LPVTYRMAKHVSAHRICHVSLYSVVLPPMGMVIYTGLLSRQNIIIITVIIIIIAVLQADA
jgi:hypothetical protein